MSSSKTSKCPDIFESEGGFDPLLELSSTACAMGGELSAYPTPRTLSQSDDITVAQRDKAGPAELSDIGHYPGIKVVSIELFLSLYLSLKILVCRL